jgi:RHS repeat-associated protein
LGKSAVISKGPAVDQVVAQENVGTSGSNALLWLLQDNLQSTRGVVNNSGQTINAIDYDPFGNIVAIVDPSNGNAVLATAATRFLFTGQEYDRDTGLYYYNRRWYDTKTQAFLSRDPLGFSASDANLYRYVNNSPTNYSDPNGTKVYGVALNFQFTCALGGELTLYLLEDDEGRRALVIGYTARAGFQGDLSLSGVLSEGDLPGFISGNSWDVGAGFKAGFGPSGGWNTRCGWFGMFGFGLGGGISGGYGSSEVIWKNY